MGNSSNYIGDKNGKGEKHGYGKSYVLYEINGVKLKFGYIGFFKNGLKHGHGILTSENGWKICGIWQDDILDGFSILTCKDEDFIYQGTMKESGKDERFYKHGFGSYITYNKDSMLIYTGSIRMGKNYIGCEVKKNAMDGHDIKLAVVEMKPAGDGVKDGFIISLNIDGKSWSYKKYVDSKASIPDIIQGDLCLLDGMIGTNSSGCMFKRNYKYNKSVLLPEAELMQAEITSLFRFGDKICVGPSTFLIKETTHFQNGSFHLILEGPDHKAYHCKATICSSRANIYLCSWEKQVKIMPEIRDLVAKPYTLSHVIASIKCGRFPEGQITVFDLESTHEEQDIDGPKLYIEIDDYLENNKFLSEQIKTSTFKIEDLSTAFEILLKQLTYMQNHGIVHNNLMPEHIWFDKATKTIKFVGLSSVSFITLKGDVYNKHIALQNGHNVMKLVLSKFISSVSKEALKSAMTYLYKFDYFDDIKNKFQYLSSEAKAILKREVKIEETKKISLIRKDVSSFALCFFKLILEKIDCIMAFYKKSSDMDDRKLRGNKLIMLDTPNQVKSESELQKKQILYMIRLEEPLLKIDAIKSSPKTMQIIKACEAMLCDLKYETVKAIKEKMKGEIKMEESAPFVNKLMENKKLVDEILKGKGITYIEGLAEFTH